MLAVVTGASGHVGNVLVRNLLRAGLRVRALDTQFGASLEGLDIDRITASVLDRAGIRRAVSGADVVFHLAGIISVTGDPTGQMWSVNVDGTSAVAEAALAAGVSRFVHCSSVHAYDLEQAGAGLDEAGPRAVAAHLPAYDRSKAAAETVIGDAIDAGLHAIIVNPTGVIGPFDFGTSRMARVLIALRQRRLPATLEGEFDWVDVRDVADALMAAAQRGTVGSNYLVGGRQASLDELAHLAGEVTGVAPPPVRLPMWFARMWTPLATSAGRRTGNPMWYTADSLHALRFPPNLRTRKAEMELQYRPQPLAGTLADFYSWSERRLPVLSPSWS